MARARGGEAGPAVRVVHATTMPVTPLGLHDPMLPQSADIDPARLRTLPGVCTPMAGDEEVADVQPSGAGLCVRSGGSFKNSEFFNFGDCSDVDSAAARPLHDELDMVMEPLLEAPATPRTYTFGMCVLPSPVAKSLSGMLTPSVQLVVKEQQVLLPKASPQSELDLMTSMAAPMKVDFDPRIMPQRREHVVKQNFDGEGEDDTRESVFAHSSIWDAFQTDNDDAEDAPRPVVAQTGKLPRVCRAVQPVVVFGLARTEECVGVVAPTSQRLVTEAAVSRVAAVAAQPEPGPGEPLVVGALDQLPQLSGE